MLPVSLPSLPARLPCSMEAVKHLGSYLIFGELLSIWEAESGFTSPVTVSGSHSSILHTLKSGGHHACRSCGIHNHPSEWKTRSENDRVQEHDLNHLFRISILVWLKLHKLKVLQRPRHVGAHDHKAVPHLHGPTTQGKYTKKTDATPHLIHRCRHGHARASANGVTVFLLPCTS
jgi:hypothetical protein